MPKISAIHTLQKVGKIVAETRITADHFHKNLEFQTSREITVHQDILVSDMEEDKAEKVYVHRNWY